MAEAGKAAGGPRSNPLYGGPSGVAGGSGGGRTPAWARKSQRGSSAFSDTASTPPESPARDVVDPPYAYYTVETPLHSDATGASPYHAPPYYVQTPAMSDPGGTYSGYSSAISSPSRFESHGINYASDSDTQSVRDGAGPSKTRFGRSSEDPSISRIDEEEEDFPDPDRDRQRYVKQVTCVVWITIFILVLMVGVAALIAWSIWRPDGPTYSILNVDIHRLDFEARSFDAVGISTAGLYGNVTVKFGVHNPNALFDLHHRTGSLEFGYSRLVVLSGEVMPFDQATKSRTNFSANAIAWNQPLYGVGHMFEQAVDETFLNLTLLANLKARANVVWRILVSDFDKQLLCTIGLNTTTLVVLNTTCPHVFR